LSEDGGVSHQAPYYYFGDRGAILAAIAAEGFSTLGQSFLRAVDRAGSEPAKALALSAHRDPMRQNAANYLAFIKLASIRRWLRTFRS
jgi:AcrR family transcriptional regulator